jgi:hypothetical protein
MDIATILWVLFFPWIIEVPSLHSSIFLIQIMRLLTDYNHFAMKIFLQSWIVRLLLVLSIVRLFCHARQRFGDAEVPKFKLRLIGKRDNELRQYDDPSLNDIGGLVVGDIGHSRSDRDIIIESSSGTLQRISKLHLKFMAFHYPLLFPYGEDGFHTDIMLAHQEQQHLKKDKRL